MCVCRVICKYGYHIKESNCHSPEKQVTVSPQGGAVPLCYIINLVVVHVLFFCFSIFSPQENCCIGCDANTDEYTAHVTLLIFFF